MARRPFLIAQDLHLVDLLTEPPGLPHRDGKPAAALRRLQLDAREEAFGRVRRELHIVVEDEHVRELHEGEEAPPGQIARLVDGHHAHVLPPCRSFSSATQYRTRRAGFPSSLVPSPHFPNTTEFGATVQRSPSTAPGMITLPVPS